MTLQLRYNKLATMLPNAELDWTANTIKCVILDDTYVFDATHDFYDDISAFELPTADGYTAGGVTLTGKTDTFSDPWQVLDADDPEWPGGTFSGQYAVFLKSTGVASTSPLLLCVDAETVIDNIQIVPIDPDGLIRIGG